MQLWPKLIQRAKEGGLNTIETYVCWNAHEPEKGKVTDKCSCGLGIGGNQPQQN